MIEEIVPIHRLTRELPTELKQSYPSGEGQGLGVSVSLVTQGVILVAHLACRANQLCKLFSGNSDNPSSFLSSTLILVKLNLKTAANLDLISGVLQHFRFADLGFLSI